MTLKEKLKEKIKKDLNIECKEIYTLRLSRSDRENGAFRFIVFTNSNGQIGSQFTMKELIGKNKKLRLEKESGYDGELFYDEIKDRDWKKYPKNGKTA